MAAGERRPLKHRHTGRSECRKQQSPLALALQACCNPDVRGEQNRSDEHERSNGKCANRPFAAHRSSLIALVETFGGETHPSWFKRECCHVVAPGNQEVIQTSCFGAKRIFIFCRFSTTCCCNHGCTEPNRSRTRPVWSGTLEYPDETTDCEGPSTGPAARAGDFDQRKSVQFAFHPAHRRPYVPQR
jgi:hypothetical protein